MHELRAAYGCCTISCCTSIFDIGLLSIEGHNCACSVLQSDHGGRDASEIADRPIQAEEDKSDKSGGTPSVCGLVATEISAQRVEELRRSASGISTTLTFPTRRIDSSNIADWVSPAMKLPVRLSLGSSEYDLYMTACSMQLRVSCVSSQTMK